LTVTLSDYLTHILNIICLFNMATTPPCSPKEDDFGASQKAIGAVEVEQIEGTVRLFDTDGHIRKVPIPSKDPTDPLTWSTWKRCLVLLSLSIFGVAGFGVIQSTPLFFSQIIAEYERETRGVREASVIEITSSDTCLEIRRAKYCAAR
jgi:hypothetical protein